MNEKLAAAGLSAQVQEVTSTEAAKIELEEAAKRAGVDPPKDGE